MTMLGTRTLAGTAGRPLPAQLVLAIFVGSGAAGLIYQVVWSRELVLVFGNTTEAVGTIVTAFMAGLGLGGLVAGLVAPRIRRPLLVYGVAELGVAAAALLVPLGLQLVTSAYASAYDGTPPAELTVVRFLLTMALLTPVTFLMGLTLPLLTRALVTSMGTAGPRMGELYSANTFGAVAGTLVSGLLLIELLGLTTTSHVAVALNVLAGLVALALALREPAENGGLTPDQPAREEGGARVSVPALRFLLYASSFVAGFVALALEVLWTRMLAEGTGSLSYNFVAILGVYLLGVAVGGWLYRMIGSEVRDTTGALALVLCGIAAATLLTVPLGGLWLGPHYLLRVVVLLPATVCMGYAFPLTARLLTRDPAHGARSIGVLYGCNTAGSILGSLGATFVLAGTLGTNASSLVLAAVDAAVALALVVAVGRGLRWRPLRLAPVPLALVLIPVLLVGTSSSLEKTSTEHWLDANHRPYHHVEDSLSTVDAVGGAPADRRLFVSGTAMTALSVDTKLMAYLPKAMHPNASRFLNIAFGMGTTYRSALRLGLRTDAVDLSPSVPWQMGTFYSDAGQYLHHPLGRVITADGRNYARLSDHTYDIISVDPPPPVQSAGTGVLYSREFYADAHRRLRPDGLMVQWLYFGVTMDELKQHLHTFRSVFPHVEMLLSPMHGGVYMIGSNSPIEIPTAAVSQRLAAPSVQRDIAQAPDYWKISGKRWPALLDGMRWLRDDEVDRFAGDAPLITDDHPTTEYYLLRRLLIARDTNHVTYEDLRQAGPSG
jgi:spermidine synthase